MGAEIDWQCIYAETLPRVFNYMLYRTGETKQAEDLTSITFVQAWQHRDRYQAQRAQPITWLLGIARHVVANEFRHGQRCQPIDMIANQFGSETIEEVVEQEAMVAQLRGLVRQLPAREQELIALKYGAGLTNREITLVTDLSESNVSTILHRTIKKLREDWKRES